MMVEHLKSFNNNKLEMWFFTATPEMLVEHHVSQLKSVYQLSGEYGVSSHITPFSLFDAISAQANAPFQIINVVDLPPLKEAFKFQRGEFNEAHLGKVLSESIEHHGVVFDLYKNGTYLHPIQGGKRLFGEFAMAFCAGIAHAEKLAQFLNNHFKTPTRTDDGQSWQFLKDAYEKNVRAHFNTKENIAAFLAKYPFVFADAVHSGNEAHPLSEQEARDKLLRNKLGGSLFLAGATKLMEGFDNPRIKVLFNLKPVRRSNTKLVQSIGRGLRIDTKNPSAITKVFEFVYDKNQLLTSSSQVLGVMNYGLAPVGNLEITVAEHEPGTAEYKLSYSKLVDIKIKQSGKKRMRADGGKEPPLKKAKIVPQSYSTLAKDLQNLIKELKEKIKVLPYFDNKTTFQDEGMDVDVAPTSSSSSSSSYKKDHEDADKIIEQFDEPDDKLDIESLLQKAQELFDQAKEFFGDDRLSVELSLLAKRFSHIENLATQTYGTAVGIKQTFIRSPKNLKQTGSAGNKQTRSDDGIEELIEELKVLEFKQLGLYSRPTIVVPNFYVIVPFRKAADLYYKSMQVAKPGELELDVSEMQYAFSMFTYPGSHVLLHKLPNSKESLFNIFKGQLIKEILSNVRDEKVKVFVLSTRPSPEFEKHVSEVQEILAELGFQKIEKSPAKPQAADNHGTIDARDSLFGPRATQPQEEVVSAYDLLFNSHATSTAAPQKQ